ncbi:MAG: P1 family peptidase [Rhodocyclaceae bacterium]|nr:P1 family peptidase [Rhodocyclaceae bacterium]
MKQACITDLLGISIGHYQDPRRPTGCTVVLCPTGAVGGVAVVGAAPGTRETDLLNPTSTVNEVHAIVLSGGSAFGLDSASGVMRWLHEHDFGLSVGPVRVPIVPAAVLFDLFVDDFVQPGGSGIYPDADAGYAACVDAMQNPTAALRQGNVGAGTGATVGKLNGPQCAMRGGLGWAALNVNGITVAAIIACNAVGDVVDPQTGAILAGARTAPDSLSRLNAVTAELDGLSASGLHAGSNTTIGVIITDATLSKAQAQRLAQVGHDGLARTIRPVHTAMDGDTLFTLATGKNPAPIDAMQLATAAAEVTAMAVINAVTHAQSLRLGSTWWPDAGEA